MRLLLEWGEPQVPAADLVAAAKSALRLAVNEQFNCPSAVTAPLLIKELRKLHPAELHQLFEGEDPVSAVDVATALTDAWA